MGIIEELEAGMRKQFNEKFAETKDIIGPRYTPEFNVETEAEKFLNLFLLNDKAIRAINNIKNKKR